MKVSDLKFLDYSNNGANFQLFSVFDNINSIWYPFRKFTPPKKPIRSEPKNVATGSVSKRYRKCLLAQLPENFF